jgi:hypothetical protein
MQVRTASTMCLQNDQYEKQFIFKDRKMLRNILLQIAGILLSIVSLLLGGGEYVTNSIIECTAGGTRLMGMDESSIF